MILLSKKHKKIACGAFFCSFLQPISNINLFEAVFHKLHSLNDNVSLEKIQIGHLIFGEKNPRLVI